MDRPGIPDFAVSATASAFCAAPLLLVRRALSHDPGEPFGGLVLDRAEDRGPKGWRWHVAAPFNGSAEIWFEPVGDGCTVHAFLRAADAADARRLDRAMRDVREALWRVKDRIESGRAAGDPALSDVQAEP